MWKYFKKKRENKAYGDYRLGASLVFLAYFIEKSPINAMDDILTKMDSSEKVTAGYKYAIDIIKELEGISKQAAQPSILLTDRELKTGLDRVRYAELLIRQLPDNHEGRNTWLSWYGRKTQ